MEEDIFLCPDILLHAAVIVEVVRGYIGDYRNVGRCFHCLELEAGQLDDGEGFGAHFIKLREKRFADIAADKDLILSVFLRKAFIDEGRCGGLSVGAGDADDLAGTEFEEQLHFRGQLCAVLHRVVNSGDVVSYARRFEYYFVVDILEVVIAADEFHAVF